MASSQIFGALASIGLSRQAILAVPNGKLVFRWYRWCGSLCKETVFVWEHSQMLAAGLMFFLGQNLIETSWKGGVASKIEKLRDGTKWFGSGVIESMESYWYNIKW
jgi:hypothetical protein